MQEVGCGCDMRKKDRLQSCIKSACTNYGTAVTKIDIDKLVIHIE